MIPISGTWASNWATGDIVTAAEFKKGVGSVFDSTLGGSAANIDVTGIVATYAHLLVTVYARGDTAATTTPLQLRFNGDSAANYDIEVLQGQTAAAAVSETFAATAIQVGNVPANTAGANLFGNAQIFIPHYAGSANNKDALSHFMLKFGTASTNLIVGTTGGNWRSNAAINRITLLPAAGQFVAGTRLTIYALGA